MRLVYIILTLALVISTACNQNQQPLKNCSDFKIGNFRTGYKGQYYNIERTDSIQKETLEGTNSWVKYKVNWINECEYSLEYNDRHIELDTYRLPPKVHVKIINTQGDSCFYRTSSESFTTETWMVKLNK